MATNLSAVIDSELKKKLQVSAKAEGRSLSNLVSFFLAKGVNTRKPAHGKAA
jgi:predicted HicB family RNase H-like nuclease